jgi:hypothetical protein
MQYAIIKLQEFCGICKKCRLIEKQKIQTAQSVRILMTLNSLLGCDSV